MTRIWYTPASVIDQPAGVHVGWCDRCGRDFETVVEPKSLCPPCFHANVDVYPHRPEIGAGGLSGC